MPYSCLTFLDTQIILLWAHSIQGSPQLKVPVFYALHNVFGKSFMLESVLDATEPYTWSNERRDIKKVMMIGTKFACEVTFINVILLFLLITYHQGFFYMLTRTGDLPSLRFLSMERGLLILLSIA